MNVCGPPGMKEMPILTESMAPLVSSYSLPFRPCVRSRDPDGETPECSKRMCSGGGRVYGNQAVQKSEHEYTNKAVEFVEVEVFGPGTPTKNDETSESSRKSTVGGWDSLELCLLERVSRSLSISDLCSLSQVNKHYNALCSRDAVWIWRAAEMGITKALEDENWRSNVKVAVSGSMHAAPLESTTSLHFSGDVTIVDPSNCSKQAELRKIVKDSSHKDLVLTYRGIQSAVVRTSCVIHDDDAAFEVFRDGEEVGANVTTSGVIAVVPKRLVLKLVEENGGAPQEVHGVTVVGVDGVLRCSSDGDFIIRQLKPGRGTLVEDPFSGETDRADIVCSTGGSWTEDSDSDDEDEELSDEEMAEAIAEVANLTDSYTTSRHLHCNGEGLIHKFTNFEVSMLS